MRQYLFSFLTGLSVVLNETGWHSDDVPNLAQALNLEFPYPPVEKVRYDPDPMNTAALGATAKYKRLVLEEAPEVNPQASDPTKVY